MLTKLYYQTLLTVKCHSIYQVGPAGGYFDYNIRRFYFKGSGICHIVSLKTGVFAGSIIIELVKAGKLFFFHAAFFK